MPPVQARDFITPPAVAVRRGDITGEAAVRQFAALHTERRGSGEIDLIDHSLMVEGDMTVRGGAKLPPANPEVISMGGVSLH